MYYSPVCLRRYLHQIVEKREIRDGVARAKRTKVSKEELEEKIEALHLNGDVMLHSSIMNIGKLQGGSKFVVEKILEKVDVSKHTLIVSALPFRGIFKEYLETKPVFDVRYAPIAMGAINEYIALLPGCKRSLHPTHSVVAIGRFAEEYTATHQLDETPFGVHSPYSKLIKYRAKVILLGATLNNLTMIHAIEDLLGELYPFKIYEKKLYNVDCINQEGKHITVHTTCHNPLIGIYRDLSFMHNDLIRNGIMEAVPLGEAELCVLDAYRFCIYYLDLMASGYSIYGRFKASAQLKDFISKVKNKI